MKRIAVVVFVLLFDLISGLIASENHCEADILVIYKIKLTTNWSKDLFPKQYPEFRPPAQWSASYGETNEHLLSHLPKIYSNSSGRQDQMSADVYFVCESR
jgi:hypothetical protein